MAIELYVSAMLLLVGAAPEGTPKPVDHLARARICVTMLDYECAERELSQERASIGTASTVRHAEVFQLSAEVALATERPAAASSHLENLLRLRPDFVPARGTWPTPWVEALEATRRSMPDVAAPELHVVVASARESQPLEVVIEADDRSGVGRVILNVLSGTRQRQLVLATTDGRTWAASIPEALVIPPHIDLWVEAYDRLGNGPARWGQERAPRRVSVTAKATEPSASVFERWWFWTAVGVVAVGATVTAIALTGDDGSTDNGSSTREVGDLNVVFSPPP